MRKRLTFPCLAALAATLLFGFDGTAAAMTGDPSLAFKASKDVGTRQVRWVCGPYQCAWIPNYRGRVVVYPHMRGWKPPPSPHCIYRHGVFGWWLHCP